MTILSQSTFICKLFVMISDMFNKLIDVNTFKCNIIIIIVYS